MIRLGALLFVTLAALFLVMDTLGRGNLRAERQSARVVRPAAQDAEASGSQPPQGIPAPTDGVIEATAQAPRQQQRFPGPALRPSPERDGARPAAAAPAGEALLYVTGSRVNVRSGPSTDAAVVAALDRGAAVRRIGPAGGEWVNVALATGATGFVAATFLSSDAP